MRRSPTVVTTVVLLIAGLIWSFVDQSSVAKAASATAALETVLRESPDPEAAILRTVPAGGALSLDGAPVGEFYPVTYDGTSGWLTADVLVVTKDTVVEPVDPAGSTETPVAPVETAVPNPPVEAVPTESVLDQATLGAMEPTAVPAESVLDLATIVAIEPTSSPVEPTTVPLEPPQVATTIADAIEAVLTATVPPTPDDPAPPTRLPVATETSDPSESTSIPSTEAVATVEPTAVPTVEPTPTPTFSINGPATAIGDVALRDGPDDRGTFLFSVSAGSTVVRTGRAVNGWVSADYMGIAGWVRADQLAEPLPVAPEPTATPTPEATAVATGVGGPDRPVTEPEPARAARPGTGTAFALMDVTLRSGPSASYAEMASIASGTPLVLTGVMENGFVRVDYEGQVGWVAFDLLSHPAAPTPATSPRGTDARRVYSRQEIIQAIYAAADEYGQPRADMLRVAQCESNLDPYAVNASGSYGLFQFISSTWDSTPFANRNIFDPRANAKAAAWMWAEGRRSEWVCQ